MARESRDADTLEAPKDLVRRHFEEIFNRQNLDAYDETMAEDFVEHAEDFSCQNKGTESRINKTTWRRQRSTAVEPCSL